MEILVLIILVPVAYFCWKQYNETKKLRHKLKQYNTEKILPIEVSVQRLRQETLGIIREVLNKEQIKKIDDESSERVKEFLKEKEDPMSEIFEKEWF